MAHNSCEAPEENWQPIVVDNVETAPSIASEPEFDVSEVVWAKFANYPWWPAVTAVCAETGTYVRTVVGKKEPASVSYYVVFLGPSPSHRWLKIANIVRYAQADASKLNQIMSKRLAEQFRVACDEADRFLEANNENSCMEGSAIVSQSNRIKEEDQVDGVQPLPSAVQKKMEDGGQRLSALQQLKKQKRKSLKSKNEKPKEPTATLSRVETTADPDEEPIVVFETLAAPTSMQAQQVSVGIKKKYRKKTAATVSKVVRTGSRNAGHEDGRNEDKLGNVVSCILRAVLRRNYLDDGVEEFDLTKSPSQISDTVFEECFAAVTKQAKSALRKKKGVQRKKKTKIVKASPVNAGRGAVGIGDQGTGAASIRREDSDRTEDVDDPIQHKAVQNSKKPVKVASEQEKIIEKRHRTAVQEMETKENAASGCDQGASSTDAMTTAEELESYEKPSQPLDQVASNQMKCITRSPLRIAAIPPPVSIDVPVPLPVFGRPRFKGFKPPMMQK